MFPHSKPINYNTPISNYRKCEFNLGTMPNIQERYLENTTASLKIFFKNLRISLINIE
jgi:hypothetical protein